jgi:hypothetical protein
MISVLGQAPLAGQVVRLEITLLSRTAMESVPTVIGTPVL